MADNHLRILDYDGMLAPFEGDLSERMRRFEERKARLTSGSGSLTDFANAHHYYGFHRTQNGWVYREWAPGAQDMHLTGDFNGWDRLSHPMKRMDGGNWEIELQGENALWHGCHVKVCVTANGDTQERFPLYTTYVDQDAKTQRFCPVIWSPEHPFEWTDAGFAPQANIPPLIYETHVGMATEEQRVGTYAEFTRDVLPRIAEDGYNTVQLMAIMEHPYYASFGYQVSNFYAASSRYGTPDELKALVNEAHRLGLTVLLDLVHSHAVKNTIEGINCFDGTDYQFFKRGPAGDHPAWNSKVFDYGSDEVVHYLLSNLKFWLEEYHFDGFRFDGVTSMLYLDHGLGKAFTDYSQYFSMNTDVDAVTYLQLATALTHEVKPGALCVAEDMSGMPGMCLPIEYGGIGFDYRLGMGLPDFYIKTIKEKEDGHWEMGRLFYELATRRPGEKSIGYAESHDQALVGDKTIMFRLADKEMYWGMERGSNNYIVDRAMALHKMIRLVTIAAGGDGYLNFMGNEFGHPEWIDFPREGNGWSYAHARRLWSLAYNGFLRYEQLGDFDKAMVWLIRMNGTLTEGLIRFLRIHEQDQLLAFERKGLVFLFNFHPTNSQTAMFVPAPELGDYRVVLSTDDPAFGGQGRIDKSVVYHTWARDEQMGDGFEIYLPARTAAVLQKTDA